MEEAGRPQLRGGVRTRSGPEIPAAGAGARAGSRVPDGGMLPGHWSTGGESPTDSRKQKRGQGQETCSLRKLRKFAKGEGCGSREVSAR